jgi:uncharacterized protein
MRVFLDTSGIMAVMNSDDVFHLSAKETWQELLSNDAILFCNNYILVESFVLLQSRFGLEAVRIFQNDILPVLNVDWVDEQVHNQAVSALFVSNRRTLSLVDCTSFETMRHLGISHVFGFDRHFQEQGFEILPASG